MSAGDDGVAIVGAGPVGLYLAALLARRGVAVRVLEARERPASHSRAIGLHPPGLAALAEVDAAEELLARGTIVRRGVAWTGDPRRGLRRLGALDFARLLPEPYPFVLTVPQPVTEAVLARRLEAAAPGAVRRGVRVTDVEERGDGVRLRLEGPDGREELRARACVLCGGASGAGAAMAGVGTRGGRYRDTYLMGDVPDGAARDGPSAEAVIHLPPAGVVESFPLPGGLRRWVVRTPRPLARPEPTDLTTSVRERVGVRLDPEGVRDLSAFGVQRRLAARAAVGRVWLAGDAAHVVSPIGGQGMNLGWLGARDAAEGLLAVLAGEVGPERAAVRYDGRVRARALAAARRAEWNMRAGRPTPLPALRDATLRALLASPTAPWLARLFTMQA